MPREINLDQISDVRDAFRVAATELEAGNLIAVSDECGWRILGLATDPGAAEKMHAFHRAVPSAFASVGVFHPDVATDYADHLPKLFHKLSMRCWPGPVILRGGGDRPEGLSVRWPPPAQVWALSERGRAFSLPGDPFMPELLTHLSAPVLSLVVAPDVAEESLPAREEMLLVRSSIQRYPGPPTVVAFHGEELVIEHEGVVSQRMLARLSGDVYLFVCTGNTCRSPMAEALFRKMLSERLQCHEDELLDHGFAVISAGLSAYPGAPAAQEAVQLLKQEGADLSAHESQPLSEELLMHCDQIVTMTQSHMNSILSAYPELNGRVRMLSPQARDVCDPIGGGPEEYSRCRAEIAEHLQGLIDEIDLTGK